MGWLLKTVSYEDYINSPQDYILRINPHGKNEIIKKAFIPDSAGNPLIKEVTKPPQEKISSDEIKMIFNNLKLTLDKKIEEEFSPIIKRIDKVEKEIQELKTISPTKSPRLILGLIALTSLLVPFRSLHEPKIEPPKIQAPKSAFKPRVYYRPVPKPEVFTPIYKVIKLFQDFIEPR